MAAIAWLLVAAPGMVAHGGAATLQVGSGRAQPGATIELLGDMSTEGSVQIALAARNGGTPRSLGSVTADGEGHFQAYVTLPVDLVAGTYEMTAHSDVDRAMTMLEVMGVPIAVGEGGTRPGQDEVVGAGGDTDVGSGDGPLARVEPAAGDADPGAGSTDRFAQTGPKDGAGVLEIAAPLALGVAIALGSGAAVRRRSRPAHAGSEDVRPAMRHRDR